VTSIEVRMAREEDWRTIRDLRLRALIDAPDAFGSTHQEEREKDEVAWRSWVIGWSGAEQVTVLAQDGDAWVGLAVGLRWKPVDDVAHLFAMWVDGAYRGRSIGVAMVEAIAEWAKVTGAETLELRVTEANAPAVAPYRDASFVDTGERSTLREGSPVMTMTMRRQLRPPGRAVDRG